jgi:autophagy-related protein 18
MCFNATSTLLGVVGDSGTVHVFNLGGGRDEEREGGGGGRGRETGGAMSPTGSYDSRDNPGGGGMEGGYEAFIDEKKKSMGCVLLFC